MRGKEGKESSSGNDEVVPAPAPAPRSLTLWRRWIRQPQTLWLRRAVFQVHLWVGIGLGLYIFLISVTGSVLVFRNELYRAATPEPLVVLASGARLTEAQLRAVATRAYPGSVVQAISTPRNPNQAVSIALLSGAGRRERLFNPYTGADLGEDSVPVGIRLVTGLLALHDDLLGGPTGRRINGIGAVMTVVLALTGIIVWWPGIRSWRRSLMVPRNAGWPRTIWGLHSMIGFWTFGIVLLFGLSGVYLGNPAVVQDIADWIEPLTDANEQTRVGDRLIYWLAYLHFGRVNGIGIPCDGPGLCDVATKFTWAVAGLAPACMFATGAVMWWNRVVRKNSV